MPGSEPNWVFLTTDWWSSGVDVTIPGVGGEPCARFLPQSFKLKETVFWTIVTLFEFYTAFKVFGHYLPVRYPQRTESCLKSCFTLVFALTFGMELGLKFASRQMVWILNPCHISTIIQLILLTSKPCRFTTILFRLHMYWLSGGICAILFPVLNTRLLPFEKEVYFIQHILMLVAPFLLMSARGSEIVLSADYYEPEPFHEKGWCVLGVACFMAYHYWLLQPLGMYLKLNLNNMLCPAVSDPFHSKWYRTATVFHQTAQVTIQGKFVGWLGGKIQSSLYPECSLQNGTIAKEHTKTT